MNKKGLRQVDILNFCKPYSKKYNVKFNKSDISQYISGKTEPSQDKLYILSLALNVNPVWLMGYDVPIDKVENNIVNVTDFTSKEKHLVHNYRQLDDYGKETVEYIIERELNRSTVSETSESYNIIKYYSDSMVSAGHGTITLDNPPTDTIKIPNIDKYKNANYAVMVTGDSMNPLYNDKDIVIVEITQAINVGEIGIFSHNSDSYIKKYGDKQLISLNPKHKPIDIDETTRCMGRVLGKV